MDQMQRKMAVLMEQVLWFLWLWQSSQLRLDGRVYFIYIKPSDSHQAKLMAITYNTTCFTCSPWVHVGFVQVLWLHFTSQKHTRGSIGYNKSPQTEWIMWMSVRMPPGSDGWCIFTGVLLWIYYSGSDEKSEIRLRTEDRRLSWRPSTNGTQHEIKFFFTEDE